MKSAEEKITKLLQELNSQNFFCKDFSPQTDKIISFTNLILKWNNSHDLVSQKTFDEIFDHHVIDSIAAFIVYKSVNNLIPECYLDIGTGAGLPGIIWHLCFNENVQTTLIEPRIKRINFLKEVRRSLSLKNLELEESRFLDLKNKSASTHATLRALKPDLEILTKICLNSDKNRVFWLAGEKSENIFDLKGVLSENHSYTFELKEQYKRVLINFYKTP
jgi:16S rRNA (guanine(527)-N(7))-methyltransferase RsmG